MRRSGVSRIVVVQQALVRQLVGNTVKGAWVQGQACTLAKVSLWVDEEVAVGECGLGTESRSMVSSSVSLTCARFDGVSDRGNLFARNSGGVTEGLRIVVHEFCIVRMSLLVVARTFVVQQALARRSVGNIVRVFGYKDWHLRSRRL